jgi:hypothetical protein
VHSFYVQTYHIKDALIADAASTGTAEAVVEQAVTGDPALALLCMRGFAADDGSRLVP